eukprot:SRR837773.12819.p1 GENE.SRR837773.12819~~SRR837773.12819.p1  ORF type:complete len:255 (-),score=79.32 SRR837773.12819:57-752(-)
MKAKAPARANKAKAKGKAKAPADGWTPAEERVLRGLNTPAKIQAFLDSLYYDGSDHYWSVRMTLRTRRAHCMGGAMVAAHCLERLGYGTPRVVGFEARNDDSHAVAVYQVNGLWGAIGKSNFTLIRARDPVYRSLRELMMSYFDFYFNTKGEKSFTGYSRPFCLSRTGKDWLFAEEPVEDQLSDFDDPKKCPIEPVLPRGFRRKATLLPASKAVMKGGLLGSNPAGLYKPR